MKKNKTIIKRISLFLLTLCVLFCSCPFIFNIAKEQNTIAKAIENQSQSNQSDFERDFNIISEKISINIPSHSITLADFSSIVISQNSQPCLYTNQSITISTNASFDVNDVFEIEIYKVEQSNPTNITQSCKSVINEKNYYTITPPESDSNAEQLIRMRLTLSNTKTQVIPKTVWIYIVQTNINFNSNNKIL